MMPFYNIYIVAPHDFQNWILLKPDTNPAFLIVAGQCETEIAATPPYIEDGYISWFEGNNEWALIDIKGRRISQSPYYWDHVNKLDIIKIASLSSEKTIKNPVLQIHCDGHISHAPKSTHDEFFGDISHLLNHCKVQNMMQTIQYRHQYPINKICLLKPFKFYNKPTYEAILVSSSSMKDAIQYHPDHDDFNLVQWNNAKSEWKTLAWDENNVHPVSDWPKQWQIDTHNLNMITNFNYHGVVMVKKDGKWQLHKNAPPSFYQYMEEYSEVADECIQKHYYTEDTRPLFTGRELLPI